jgi:hypothetical protein
MLPKLRQHILRDSRGLSEAVTANWTAFEPASNTSWTALDGHQEHWLYTTSGTLPVHINLLTGQLLVNGLPLARLPSEFMNHFLYVPLFGKSTLEVVPADEPSMRFSAKTPYQGYTLHFGMSEQDMLIVAIGDNTRLDLLPSRVFQNRLPHAFVTNYVHWYDHTKDGVMFRLRETPWQSSDDWRLKHNQYSRRWRLVKGSDVLIDPASRSASLLSALFLSLDDAKHIHVKLNKATRIVDIEIPRLQLDFYIKKGDLVIHSRQLRGMVVDVNQSIGTLVSLVSKLTLKPEHTTTERVVIVPVPGTYGRFGITVNRSGPTQPAIVTINKEQVNQVYVYTLDTTLGRIIHNDSIQSQLFLAYLHALTSEVLSDPLTRRTGVESSLSILQSAAVRSFGVLSQHNIELFDQIASLSAKRSFYPEYLKEMQQITWDTDLLTLSQHPSFRVLVSDILLQASNMQLFHPENKVSFDLVSQLQRELLSSSSSYLDQRDALRSSSFRVAEFGAENYDTSLDVDYKARNQQESSDRGRRAFGTATMMIRHPASLHSKIPNLKSYLLRAYFDKAVVSGVDNSFDPQSLRYDSQWLSEASNHLLKKWCTLHRGLANAATTCNLYDLTTWLCTMAYASSADMAII